MKENADLRDKSDVAAVLTGNTAAFRGISERYAAMIYTLAYSQTKSKEDSQDITQDVFLAVFRSLKSYDSELKFFSWLYAIALNVIRKHLRNRHFRSRFIPLYESMSSIDTNSDVDRVPQKINLVLDKVKPLHKQVVVLHYYEGKTLGEIADALQLSEANCKVILHRMREKIRKAFPEEVEL